MQTSHLLQKGFQDKAVGTLSGLNGTNWVGSSTEHFFESGLHWVSFLSN